MTWHDTMVDAGLEHGCRMFQRMPTLEPNGNTLVGMMRGCLKSPPGFTYGVLLAAEMFSDRMRQTGVLREAELARLLERVT